MANFLSRYRDLEAIHIISHGSTAALYLGNTLLDNNNLSGYEAQLKSIGQSLSETGDILLYGCNVVQGRIGLQFVQSIAQITGADVAASDDLTGASNGGGNWFFEVKIGVIDSLVESYLQYPFTLALIKGNSGNDTLSGTINNDSLYGEGGNDNLYGGDGNDVLYTGTGDADYLTGGAGSDTYVIEKSVGSTYIQGLYQETSLDTEVLDLTGFTASMNNLTFSQYSYYGIDIRNDGSGLVRIEDDIQHNSTSKIDTVKIGGKLIDVSATRTWQEFAGALREVIKNPPTLDKPDLASYSDTAYNDQFSVVTGMLKAQDIDGDSLFYGVKGSIDIDSSVTRTGIYGVLTVNKASGAYVFTPNDAVIEQLIGSASETFTVFVKDDFYTITSDFVVNLTGTNDRPTGAVTISGAATQGQMLTASNTLADLDGIGAITYQWKANGNNIGDTSSSYSLTQSDVGKAITVTASYADAFGSTESKTSLATVAVTNVNDAPTGRVTITGAPTQGQTLTASNTLADVDGIGTMDYQWLANGSVISGANANILVLDQSMVGKAISVRASYIDGFGAAENNTSSSKVIVARIDEAPAEKANVNIQLSQSASNYIFDGSVTIGGIASSINGLIKLDAQIGATYNYFNSYKINGSTVQLNYSDGATRIFGGAIFANINAPSGTASANVETVTHPNAWQFSAEGVLNYSYQSNLSGVKYQPLPSQLDSVSMRSLYPSSSQYYDMILGNYDLRFSGKVNTYSDGRLSGVVSSITNDTEKLVNYSSLTGNISISGNASSIASGASEVSVSGFLNSKSISFVDGSVAIIKEGSIPVSNNTNSSFSELLKNPSNFQGDDYFILKFPTVVLEVINVSTGNGNDSITIEGGENRVNIYSGDGQDIIRTDNSSRFIDGGSGVDFVYFHEERTSYNVGKTQSGYSVAAMMQNASTVQLSSVERLHFTDTNLAFDTEGSAGQVYRLYKSAFARTPDLTGLGSWIDAMDKGQTLQQVASTFAGSPEFQSLYGTNTSNEAFVTLLYLNALGRAPEAGSVTNWASQIATGAITRAQLLAQFSESTENKSAVQNSIKDGILYASADQVAIATHGLTLNGTTGADSLFGSVAKDILSGLAGNDVIGGGAGIDISVYGGLRSGYTITRSATSLTVEGGVEGIDTLVDVERLKFSDGSLAFDVNGNAGQVYRLYQAALDRTPDIQGLSGWIRDMDNGMTLQKAATGFIGSTEFQGKYGANPSNDAFITLLYENVLNRTPDEGGKSYWMDELSRGLTKEMVLIGFSESAENQAAVIGVIQNGIQYISE